MNHRSNSQISFRPVSNPQHGRTALLKKMVTHSTLVPSIKAEVADPVESECHCTFPQYFKTELKPEKAFVCERCPFHVEFPNEDVYLRHMDIAHLFNPSVMAAQSIQTNEDCVIVERPPCSSRPKIGLGRNLLKCQVCSAYFQSFESLQTHRTDKNHQFAVAHCPKCDEIFRCDSSDFDAHLSTAHFGTKLGKPLLCLHPCCVSKFYSKKHLAFHINKWHKDTLFSCKYCFEVFRSKATMIFHVKSSCKRRKQQMLKASNEDSIVFLNETNVNVIKEVNELVADFRNIQIENANRSSKCSLCNDGLIYEPLKMVIHRQETHSRRLILDEAEDLLKYHRWKPLKPSPPNTCGRCRVCDEPFECRFSLNEHEFRHIGIESVLEKDVKLQSVKRKADGSKTILRKLCCPQCKVSFKSDAELNEHITSTYKYRSPPAEISAMTDAIRFECIVPNCNVVLENGVILIGHVILKHHEEAFICKFCCSMFFCPESLATHHKTNCPATLANCFLKCSVCLDGERYYALQMMHHRLSKHRELVSMSETANFLQFHNWMPECYSIEGDPNSLGKCRICGQNGFRDRKTLCDHELQHLAMQHYTNVLKCGGYPCSRCVEVFHSLGAFINHKQMHLKYKSPAKFSCPLCFATFPNKMAATYHRSKAH